MKNLTDNKMTFQTEDTWMVQCLSLATIGILAYLHISTVISGIA